MHFPRKKGYKIAWHEIIIFSKRGYNKIDLHDICESYENPYISFHPRNEKIHINCFGQNKIFKRDLPIINFSKDKPLIVFPFADIIFKYNIDYLDIYDNDKYITSLIFTCINKENHEIALSIEIWVHSTSVYLDVNDLPCKEARKMHNLLNLLILN